QQINEVLEQNSEKELKAQINQALKQINKLIELTEKKNKDNTSSG
ncbi:15704_t:CDS:1, partial [Racocetra fulgida]